MQLVRLRLVLGDVANDGAVPLQRSLDKPAPRVKCRWALFVEDVLAPCGQRRKSSGISRGVAASAA